jgi:sialidase-1
MHAPIPVLNMEYSVSLKRVSAKHGMICSMSDQRYGYFGWPSVARTESGRLVVGVSGYRYAHICPWGKSVLFNSDDDGKTWSDPRVVNDTPLDDRDVGIISLGGEKLLMTWFSCDQRVRNCCLPPGEPPEMVGIRQTVLDAIPEETYAKWRASWIRTSVDGGNAWGDCIPAPVSAPHGPIRLSSGNLLFLGQQWCGHGSSVPNEGAGDIRAARSSDDGQTWIELGSVLVPDGIGFAEPHVVELVNGRLIGLIRASEFEMYQTESDDDGVTWTPARRLGIYGSPPHLIRHSSGTLVCVYGYRKPPHGERAMFSYDGGVTWDYDWAINDAPSEDLGYPCSVELPDGRILTVYYQYEEGETRYSSLQYSVWELPG